MSLETRIAVIGVVGALAGTLVGGLVTYAVTQDQISSQKKETRRTERLNAYSQYFGDASNLWTQVFAEVEVTPRPRYLSGAKLASLKSLEATLSQEYALVSLVAPQKVHDTARKLNVVDTDVWNAVNSAPIDYRLYEAAKRQILGPKSLFLQFLAASRSDLGTGSG
jgi:pyrroline-5-carboxylate reductase